MRPSRNRLKAESLTVSNPEASFPLPQPVNDQSNNEEAEKVKEAEDSEISDSEYMKRRMKKNLLGEEQDQWEQDDEGDEKTKKDDEAEIPAEASEVLEKDAKVSEDQLNRESILESSRIFLRNLPYSISEEELFEKFSPYGEIDEVIYCSIFYF